LFVLLLWNNYSKSGENKLFVLSKQEKCAILGSIAGGFVAQGIGLTNKFAFSDDLNHMFDVGVTLPSGRSGLFILSSLEQLIYGNGQYALPLYNGALAIIAIASAVCILVRLFQITDCFLAAVLGALWTAFPSLTALMYYDFTIHLYMIGLLIGIGGSYLICASRKWPLFLSGVVLIGISIGVYQAFFPIFVVIMLLDMIQKLEEGEAHDTKTILYLIIRKIVALLGGLTYYYMMNALLLKLCREEYAGYMGIGSEFEVSIKDYCLRVAVAVREFFVPRKIFSESTIYAGNSRYIYMILVLGLGVMCIMYVHSMWWQQSKIARVVLLLCIGFIPLAVNLMWVLSSYRILRMEYSLVSVFLVVVFFLERIDGKYCHGAKVALKAVLILLCLGFIRTDNISYLKTTFVQSEAIQYFNTLIASIKNTEGYKDEYPVLFINSMDKTDSSLKSFEDFEALPEDPRRELQDYLNDFMWQEYMAVWCGYYPTLLTDTSAFTEYRFDDMPEYPDKGSIVVEDSVVIVKF